MINQKIISKNESKLNNKNHTIAYLIYLLYMIILEKLINEKKILIKQLNIIE